MTLAARPESDNDCCLCAPSPRLQSPPTYRARRRYRLVEARVVRAAPERPGRGVVLLSDLVLELGRGGQRGGGARRVRRRPRVRAGPPCRSRASAGTIKRRLEDPWRSPAIVGRHALR